MDATERRGYVTIASAAIGAVAAHLLAALHPTVAGYAWIFPVNGGHPFDRAIWRPDPMLTGAGDSLWLVATVATLWLAARTISRLPHAIARLRWVALGTLAGAFAGLAFGAFAYWLERPRVVLSSEAGMVAVTREVQDAIGLVGGIASWSVQWLGHDVWLILGPVVAWGLYGALVSLFAVIASGLVLWQPNVALKLTKHLY